MHLYSLLHLWDVGIWYNIWILASAMGWEAGEVVDRLKPAVFLNVRLEGFLCKNPKGYITLTDPM